LLTANLGIEREPNDIATSRCRGRRLGYHDSCPTGGPQSVSECRFSGVTPPSKS
jgi:hypothetical protein